MKRTTIWMRARRGTKKMIKSIISSRKAKCIIDNILGLYPYRNKNRSVFVDYRLRAVNSDRMMYRPMVAERPANPKKMRKITAAARMR